MRVNPQRRRLLFAAAFIASRAADAAEPPGRTYAVLSLVGDAFSIVTRRDTVGSGMDRNEHQSLPIDGTEIDDVAVAAVRQAAMRALGRDAELARVSIRDPRLYALEDQLLDESAETAALRDSVRDVLRKAGATHLLLVTKRRQEATFHLAHGSTGSGKVSGVGFYIDNQRRTRHGSTGESAVGILAPFAYATVSLVEVATMKSLKAQPASASRLVTPARSPTATRAWDSLGDDEKNRALREVLRKAVVEATTELLAT